MMRKPVVTVVRIERYCALTDPNPGKPVVLSDDDTIDAPNALPGLSCKVADLFPPL